MAAAACSSSTLLALAVTSHLGASSSPTHGKYSVSASYSGVWRGERQPAEVEALNSGLGGKRGIGRAFTALARRDSAHEATLKPGVSQEAAVHQLTDPLDLKLDIIGSLVSTLPQQAERNGSLCGQKTATCRVVDDSVVRQ
ncbi:hypothetical protein SAMN05216266_1451 [Amycolatopsis marina]|uniref:Uncharacterized protein n=1 Tax=Amycolatopsis marina TaxID=490629 RepID=A0A1I1CUJ5_9PSEU|nr:hypothetical protein [Prauserella muralis]SFB64568.1 hypothetical protein SAMN05216266_1451 [Amycolatopsis marina]